MENNKKIYNIKDYGARVCDWLQTDCIQKAIDDCFLNGGGKIVIPKGIYRTGGLRLRSCCELHLESGAILMGSTDPEDYNGYINDTVEPVRHWSEDDPARIKGGSVYPFSHWCNALIRAFDAHDISITGDAGSYINGMNVYDPNGEEGYRGPHGICIWCCENIYLEGYTITDCANWGHAIFKTNNITCRNVTVYGGHDGFDVRTCDNILVEDCEFATGDDGIAGFDNNDVTVRHCRFDSSCSAFRFGGNNVLIEDCHAVSPTSFAHRYNLSAEKKAIGAQTDLSCRHGTLTFFLYYCDHRAVIRKTPGDIIIRNCTAENPIMFFDLPFDGKHQWCCNRSLGSIRFENCNGFGLSKPMHILADANEPIEFELENVTLTACEDGSNDPIIEAWNAKRIELKNVTIEGYNDPTIVMHTEGDVICNNNIKVVRISE